MSGAIAKGLVIRQLCMPGSFMKRRKDTTTYADAATAAEIIMVERTPPTCPQCETVLNGVAGDGVPQTGDVSVCASCGAVLIFEVDAQKIVLRSPETEEERKAAAEVRKQFGLPSD